MSVKLFTMTWLPGNQYDHLIVWPIEYFYIGESAVEIKHVTPDKGDVYTLLIIGTYM